jgi:hypothetical protein
MTTVMTRVREICDKEGFDIKVIRKATKKPINVTRNGVMGKYDYDKRLKGTKTVNSWKRDRFDKSYPGLSCEVFNGNGTKATGQTKLETVRKTYEGA